MSRFWTIVRLRLRTLLRRGRVERDLDKELRFHFDRQVEENLAAGMPPGRARNEALRALGGVAQIQEECRDMRRTNYIENIAQDLRYAVRTMAKNPVFTVVIVLTLALAIGANSAIFSVIDGVLLRPLPYPQPDRLMRIFHSSEAFPRFPLNAWDFRDMRTRNTSFDAMATYSRADMQLSGDGHPVRLAGFRVTAGYFRVLGIKPARGREFETNDEIPGNNRIAILSDRLWRTRFNQAADIVGRKIILDAQPFTVVGVMPPGVDHPGNRYNPVAYGDTVDFWWPFTFQGNPRNRGSHFIEGIGRLKQDVAPQRAQADLDAVIDQVKKDLPGQSNWHPAVIPLYGEIVGPVHRMLLLLLGAVGLVLLIACANAANLLLARATARQREMAVRTALGAGRARLMRQMFAESLLVALLGGGLGAGLAGAGVRGLVAMLPQGFPRAEAIQVNANVLGFTLLIALATGLLFGLAPALQASRSDPQSGLREGARGGTSRRHTQLRNALVVGEVALACVLLIGAGLLLRSFVNLLRTEPGFRADRVLTAVIALPGEQYKDVPAVSTFYDRLVKDVSTLPGVQSAGVGTDLPWTGYDDNIGFGVEGRPDSANDGNHARYHVADAGYFRTVGVPLLRGRLFDDRDRAGAPPALLINQAMAHRYFPNEEAVGKRLKFGFGREEPWTTIVGVVGDIKDMPSDAAAEPALWWPTLQTPFTFRRMAITVRAAADPAALAGELREAVHRQNSSLAVSDIRPLDQIARNGFSVPRFSLFLVGLFAGLALTLATIGIYGVIAYSVSQRTHEFGLRMALGAKPWSVMRLVMGQGVRLALIGVALGVISALALGRLLGTFLYGVKASDPLTLAAVAMAAIVTAVAACYPPARKATAADPIAALRSE